ncbi:MAG: STAS domain-containing protein [Nocardioidaceae bacterium]
MDLSLSTRESAGTYIVDIGGEIDVSSSSKLRERLVGLVNEGALRLVVNLEGVEFIDSTGLGVLVGILKRIRARDGSLAIVCSNDALLRVFTITGLEKVFAIYPSLEAATKHSTA